MVTEKIYSMIDEAKRVPVPVSEKSDLYIDLGFDSLSFIKLLIKIEEVYSITFNIIDMEKCLKVNQLVILVKNKLREQSDHD